MSCRGPLCIERSRRIRSVARARAARLGTAGRGGVPSAECKRIIRCRSRVRRAAAVVIERYGTEI